MNSSNDHRRTDRFRSRHAGIPALIAALLGGVASAQTTPVWDQPVVITIDTTDNVLYRADTFDLSKFAKNTAMTPSINTTFVGSVNVGDVRTINGQPAKGISSYQTFMSMQYKAIPQPGQTIADIDSTGLSQCVWQILSPDGKYIGSLYDTGAAPAPEHAINGGSGAFQGATGVHAMMKGGGIPQRTASTSEDPALRRTLGGGKLTTVFTLYPRSRPTVITTPNGPAVVHSDGKLVSSSNPAQANEVLTLYATGLGPTTPAVSSGQPFPQGAASLVNAPVEVLVGGKSSAVVYAGGYPGAIDGYQVNFRLPASTPGNTTLRLTAAWISGAEITIATK